MDNKKYKSDKIVNVIFIILLSIFSIFCLFPLVVALSGSLSSENAVIEKGFSILPRDLSLDTYKYVFKRQGFLLGKAYIMSITTTVVGTLISLAVTTGFAYAISVKGFKHGNKLAFFAYFTMLFSGGMLPWYIICTRYYGLKDSIWALTLPYAMNVFYMYLLRNFFKGLPNELTESAKIDGAGHFRIFGQIILPLSKAGLVTVTLFYALQYWNDFFLPLMLVNDSKYYTIQFILYKMMSNIQFLVSNSSFAEQQTIALPSQTIKLAITCIAIGPIIIVYPFIQKYFVKGVTVGALKG